MTATLFLSSYVVEAVPDTNKRELASNFTERILTDEKALNDFVFVKGTITNPVITSVIEIYEYDETNLDRVRRQRIRRKKSWRSFIN